MAHCNLWLPNVNNRKLLFSAKGIHCPDRDVGHGLEDLMPRYADYEADPEDYERWRKEFLAACEEASERREPVGREGFEGFVKRRYVEPPKPATPKS